MFTRLDCRDSRFRHTYILQSWGSECFTVSKLFFGIEVVQRIADLSLSTSCYRQRFQWKTSPESGRFVWLDSFPKHLSICIFFLIINMSHLMQFSNISNLLQKDIPENWSDFIYLFIFFIPSVLFFLFVLFWSEHAYQLWICMVPLTGEQTSNIRKWN